MLGQENPKFLASVYQPNPQEGSYWIDLGTDAYGNVIKSWNGEEWVPLNLGTNTDQWKHIQQIVDAIGLPYDAASDVISLPSFTGTHFFKGSGDLITIIKNGDSAINSQITLKFTNLQNLHNADIRELQELISELDARLDAIDGGSIIVGDDWEFLG